MKLQVNDEVEYLGYKAVVMRILDDCYSLKFPNYTTKRYKEDNQFVEYQIFNPITALIPKTNENLIKFVRHIIV